MPRNEEHKAEPEPEGLVVASAFVPASPDWALLCASSHSKVQYSLWYNKASPGGRLLESQPRGSGVSNITFRVLN